MNVSVNYANGKARLSLRGRFDFPCRLDFKEACKKAFDQPEVAEVVVDMREVEYLDSAALGMLLLLHDKARAAGKAVGLLAHPGTVCDVLRIARFDTLFDLQVS